MKTDWSNYTIAYDGINYSVNYRDNGDLVACENYVANSPTPKNPQPLISNLPAGTYFVYDYKGDKYEFTLTSDLCGIGTVLDSIEFDKYSHGGYLRKGNKKYTLQTADVDRLVTTATNIDWVVIKKPADYIGYNNTNAIGGKILTEFSLGDKTYSDNVDRIGYIATTGNTEIAYLVAKGTYADIAAARTAIVGKVIAYQLATPTRTALTFTLNDASTAPEVPMTFLTSTPSLEYPATVWDASGTVKVANADDSQNATATIETLRSNAAGTVYDEQNVTMGVVIRRMSEWANITGANTLTKADSTLLAYKVFKMSLGDLPIPATATTNITAQKYDSTLLTAVNASPTSADRIYTDGSYFYLSAAMADTGFSEAIVPTDNEVKAYFYGWKMCHSDGRSPFYKSEVPYNPDTWAEWTISNNVTFDSTGATMTVYDTYSALGMPTALKTSTKYGVLIDVVTNELTARVVTEGTSAFSAGLTVIETGASGKVKAVLTSLDTISSNRFVLKRSELEASPKTLKIKDIRVYELPTGSQIEADFTNLTADQLNTKYPFDGLNTKHWKHLVGTEAEIQASITSTLPTASYEGFTPYKMSYELAEPIEEQYTPVTLPTYYPQTIVTTTNNTPAELTTTATVKVEDEE